MYQHKTVEDIFQECMTSLVKAGRKRYVLSINQANIQLSIKEFRHSLDFYFSEMNMAWLKRYELFLREQRLVENTIGIRFRTLRAIYNVAMEEDAVSQDCYPFQEVQIRPADYNTKDSPFYCTNRALASVGTNLFVNYSYV